MMPKFLHLLLFVFCFSKTIAQNNTSPKGNQFYPAETNNPETKKQLKQMCRQRNKFDPNKLSFGPLEDALLNFKNNATASPRAANWSYISANGAVNNDIGRTTSITFDTLNPGRFYVCSNNSGVWLTNNNGQSYTPITENLPTQSVSCLLIDYTNPNTLYLATGMHNQDMPFNSLGVYKSTDAGQTWNPTGLTFTSSQEITIGDLIINHQNPNVLIAATSNGVYKTNNAGQNWVKVINDDVRSARFHPTDTAIVYATGFEYYRSNNGGNSFTPINIGFTNNNSYNYENFVRTTKAAPNVLYLAINGVSAAPNYNTNSIIYKSTDAGLNFSAFDVMGGENLPQFIVSQKQEDRFIYGYRRTFKRENSAATFTQVSNWFNSSYPYMHADQRGIAFSPYNDSTIYYCNDGGLYVTYDNANSFQNISANMQLSHLYTMSNSQQNNYKILASPLDVSPYMLGNNGITQTFTQLVESFNSNMNPINDNKFWITHQTPFFTTNNGASFYQSSHFEIGNMSYYQHDFQYNECNENVSYFGSYNNVFKSTDNGLNYQFFVTTPYNPVNSFIESPTGFNVARANPDYIYVYYSDSVYVSKTGNNNFINITAGLPTDSANIAHLAVDPTNENKIWISFKGYYNGHKVYYSNNAGQTWTNMSNGIPNFSVNKIVCQNGVAGAIYAATDGGVFYRDDSFSSWQYFNDGMPAAIVNDLELQYNLGKIRAATFGRGVWESDFYSPTPASYLLPPVALFQVSNTQSCPGELLQFTNISCGIVDSVHWIFNGASPGFSNANNPQITYNASGNYDITLIAYNQGGSDTLTRLAHITVNPSLALPYYEPVADTNIFIYPEGCYATDPNNDNNNWLRIWYADGSGGTGDDYLIFDNWNYNDNGLETKFYFPPVDLSNTQNPKLFFYRSYQRKNTTQNDTLIVYAKACGGNETIVFKKGGAQLANIAGFNSANYWMPSAPNHWLKDSISLLQFAGQPSVTFNFANKGYGGQIINIDDFLVKDTPLITENNSLPNQNTIAVYPNPAAEELYIEKSNTQSETLFLYDMLGKEIMHLTSNQKITKLNISTLSKGFYILKVNEKVVKLEKL